MNALGVLPLSISKRDTFKSGELQLTKFANGTYQTHGPKICKGPNCVLHNPSKHHMVKWPMILRASLLVERRCPCGIGHPDPDSVAYFAGVNPEYAPLNVHGCCGDCSLDGYLKNEKRRKKNK